MKLFEEAPRWLILKVFSLTLSGNFYLIYLSAFYIVERVIRFCAMLLHTQESKYHKNDHCLW